MKNTRLSNYLKNFNGNLNNTFKINFDKTYKIKKYEYKNSGKINKMELYFSDPFLIPLQNTKINQLFLNDTNVNVELNSNLKKNISLNGNYSINNKTFLPFILDNKIQKKITKLKIDLNFDEDINLKIINYEKPKDEIAKISIDLEKENQKLFIKKLDIQHKENKISIEKIRFNKGVFLH